MQTDTYNKYNALRFVNGNAGGGEDVPTPYNLKSDWRWPTEAPLFCGLQSFLILTLPGLSVQTSSLSSGKLSEQLAASLAICCSFSPGEEQVNVWLVLSHLFRSAYSYPSFSRSCAYPSVPQSLALWGTDNRSQLLDLRGERPLI